MHVIFVILVVIVLASVPFIKRAEENKAIENSFLDAWSKELGRNKGTKFFDIIGWLLIVAVFTAITIGALGGL